MFVFVNIFQAMDIYKTNTKHEFKHLYILGNTDIGKQHTVLIHIHNGHGRIESTELMIIFNIYRYTCTTIVIN